MIHLTDLDNNVVNCFAQGLVTTSKSMFPFPYSLSYPLAIPSPSCHSLNVLMPWSTTVQASSASNSCCFIDRMLGSRSHHHSPEGLEKEKVMRVYPAVPLTSIRATASRSNPGRRRSALRRAMNCPPLTPAAPSPASTNLGTCCPCLWPAYSPGLCPSPHGNHHLQIKSW